MEDSTTNPESITKLSQDEETAGTGEEAAVHLSGKRDALLPISVVGGLLGMLAGTLPAALWVVLFKVTFPPLFLFLPLFIYGGICVFKGCIHRRGFAVTCILSVIGFYLAVLSCQAALEVTKYKMLVFNLPLVTISLIGRSTAFQSPFLSASYIYPILFTLLGIALIYELSRRGRSVEPDNQNG